VNLSASQAEHSCVPVDCEVRNVTQFVMYFAEIALNCPVTWSAENCSIPSIYLVLPYLQELVENEREAQYEIVVAELVRLYEAVGDVLPFRIFARLVVALKILVKFCHKSLTR